MILRVSTITIVINIKIYKYAYRIYNSHKSQGEECGVKHWKYLQIYRHRR
jgi:hypothetical protein